MICRDLVVDLTCSDDHVSTMRGVKCFTYCIAITVFEHVIVNLPKILQYFCKDLFLLLLILSLSLLLLLLLLLLWLIAPVLTWT